MEEKKTIKISLSTLFLIIAIIVIIVMGIFCYSMYNKKIEAEEQLNEMNEKTLNLETKINTISNIISDDTKNEEKQNTISDDIVNTESNSYNFSEDEIKKTLQNYLDLQGSKQGAPSALLQKLNLLGTTLDYNEVTEDGYVKTDIKYSDYKTAMLNYVTEEWFNKNFTEEFKEINGLLYYLNSGATGNEYQVDSIRPKSNTMYIGEIYRINIDGSREKQSIDFAIENYNGKCVISYCDYY